jgi:hypothetical protein
VAVSDLEIKEEESERKYKGRLKGLKMILDGFRLLILKN